MIFFSQFLHTIITKPHYNKVKDSDIDYFYVNFPSFIEYTQYTLVIELGFSGLYYFFVLIFYYASYFSGISIAIILCRTVTKLDFFRLDNRFW